ncbi:MAG TPA: glycerol-3-phosphate 1-O-acyltransferase PlsY [Casimicrobiaceae bacterium]|nr:glycerol-3-phosphate 1-O-acyltransferase PlsY [Casimicrobiaceae bacterium]
MNSPLATLAVIAGAYLVGSVSFAVVVSKLLGLPDPHSYGSGNPGATNVLRTGNKAAAVLTLLGDAAKGALAVWLANRLAASWGDASLATAGAAVAVFLGHLYPVFHGFSGGKGVATAAGVAFALAWPLGALLLAIWLVLATAFRMASLASIAASVAAPPLGFYFLGNGLEAWSLVAIALLLVWRHRANIQRLLAGKESKIGG